VANGDVLLYRIGSLTLDPARNLLLRDGEPVDLPWRSAAALALLLEACGDTVTKEDLIGRLWPGARVEESSLHRVVSQLRKALDPASAAHIENLSRIGYRWTGPVETFTPPAPATTRPAPQPANPGQPRRFWIGLASLGLTAGATTTGFAAWRYQRRSNLRQQAEMHYLRGRHLWTRRDEPSMLAAQDAFRLSLQYDPNYAPAHSGMADVLATRRNSLDEALLSARRAVELEPSLAEGHASLGFILMTRLWKWNEGLGHLRHAAALDPNYPPARHWLALGLALTGQLGPALAEIDRAIAREPLSANLLATRAAILYFQRRHHDARDAALRAVHNSTGLHFAYEWLGRSLWSLGRRAAAVHYLRLRGQAVGQGRASDAPPPPETPENIRAALEWLRSRRDALPRIAVRAFYSALLEDASDVLDTLETSADNRDMLLMYLKVDPIYDFVRPDPRFQKVLERTGLASA
jgi:DNA-binding winged helix-turn-helix (wHTH) protein/Tfp pilus assembly protein PilF